jgi:hypothetical protein
MKRGYIAINLLLLATAVLLAYEFRSQWNKYQSTHNLDRLNPGKTTAGTSSKMPPATPGVSSYAAIVDNDVFTADRTNVVPPDAPVETTKAVAPKPILVGTMQFNEDEFALMMSDTQRDNTNYKQLKVGDILDGYTLVRILDQRVVMKTDGKEVEVRLSVNEPSKMVAREAPAAVPAGNAAGQVTSVGSSPPVVSAAASGSAAVTNQALPKGTIPVGTIINGRRKKLVPSPFGMMETWEEVK